MNHLTPEQFEDILQGAAGAPEHVDDCRLCRTRLEEKQAIANRTRKAFSSIHASSALADRIRNGIARGEASTPATSKHPRIIPLRVRRYAWSGLTAAAAVLILTLPIAFFMSTGSQATAAQAALAQIHHTNLDSLGQLVTDEDPARLSDYLESEVGHRPAMLCTGSGLDLCGCCVREFRGKPVASYVVKWKDTPVSVVAVPRAPAALGMVPARGRTAASRDLWQGRHGCCNLASVRVGEYSYCAIGQVKQDELVAVLDTLLE